MCAPGFDPRATIALPSAFIGAMGPEASTNAVYAGKIADIEDPDERAAFVAARTAEQRADVNLLRMGSDLVVDTVVPGSDLRAELLSRLRHADGWTRSDRRRHHPRQPGLGPAAPRVPARRGQLRSASCPLETDHG